METERFAPGATGAPVARRDADAPPTGRPADSTLDGGSALDDGFGPAHSDEARREAVRSFGWQMAAALYRGRWFVGIATVLVALTSAGLSLLLPNEYRADTRMLVPDQSNSLLSSLLGGGGARTAARFLGSGMQASQYARSLAILTSRQVAEAAVDSFDLVRAYELQDEEDPREAAITEVQKRVTSGVDNEYEFLYVSVLDQSPRRAAGLANFYTRALVTRSNELAVANATSYRRFIETRYRQANRAVDSLLDATKAFQQRYGVIDIGAQTQAYFQQLSAMRSEQVRQQIQAGALREQFGPEAPEVRAAESALAAATRAYDGAMNGSESSLPISRQGMPEVVRAYAQLERERLVQKSTLEAVAPLYEAARLEEQRRIDPVQVLDAAVVPTRKDSPKRSILVLVATFSALLVSTAVVLAWHLWRRRGRGVLARVRADAARA